MESPAPTPRSGPGPRNADRSSMFRFFRSLVGSKRGLKRSDGTLLGGQECPSQEQRAGSVMMHRQGIRVHFAQALEVEQRATGPLGVSPEALAMEEQCLLDGELRQASLKVGATPWNHILALYKQFQKLAMAKLPLEEESEEEEMEEEDSSFKLCVPVTFQSPLHKTFRPIDTVGFVESELKKLLVAQQESRRRKMGSREGWEPLVPPEITLEGIMGDQVPDSDSAGHTTDHPLPAPDISLSPRPVPAPLETPSRGGREPPPQPVGSAGAPGEGREAAEAQPRMQGRVRSHLGVVSSTEGLLLEEMDDLGNWPPSE